MDVPIVIEYGWMCRRILNVNGFVDSDLVWMDVPTDIECVRCADSD